MKKIVFYTMTMRSGGAERVIANLANRLINDNEVTIITLLNSKIDYELNKRIKIISASSKNSLSIINRVLGSLNLLRNTKKENPDIIIAFCPTMCFIACFFKMFIRKFKNIKLVISERNDPNNEYKTRFSRKLANFLYSKADAIVFQTDEAKSFFCDRIRDKGFIIPNPISDKFLNNSICAKKENCIINVGRLEQQKNHELLIKSCKEVFDKHPDWKLKIYGEGSLKAHLEELVKELKLEKKVLLLGRCNELEKELPRNKIFVLSSNYEGMPNSLLEALACGLVCISTDCPAGGSRELIIKNQNELLVPVNDLSSMTMAIQTVIENYDKFMIESNAEYYKSKYNTNEIIKLWKDII